MNLSADGDGLPHAEHKITFAELKTATQRVAMRRCASSRIVLCFLIVESLFGGSYGSSFLPLYGEWCMWKEIKEDPGDRPGRSQDHVSRRNGSG